MKDYEEIIENFDNIQDLSIESASNELKETVNDVLNLLDKGEIRVCNKSEKGWVVNQWIKKLYYLVALKIIICKEDPMPIGSIKLIARQVIGQRKILIKQVLEMFQML